MYEFDKCQVLNKFGNVTATGYVMEYKAGTLKIRTHDSSLLFPGQEATLLIHDEQQGECRLSANVQSTDTKSAVFSDVNFINSVQKRNNTRVNIQIKYMLRSCIKDNFEVSLEKPIEITLLNISAQGMYFNCDQELDTGFTFPLDFKETRRPLRLIVKVIRREDYARGFNYGCFFDISERDMDEIFRFVLKEQIEQRRKRMVF